jgi:hypothetical protein
MPIGKFKCLDVARRADRTVSCRQLPASAGVVHEKVTVYYCRGNYAPVSRVLISCGIVLPWHLANRPRSVVSENCRLFVHRQLGFGGNLQRPVADRMFPESANECLILVSLVGACGCRFGLARPIRARRRFAMELMGRSLAAGARGGHGTATTPSGLGGPRKQPHTDAASALSTSQWDGGSSTGPPSTGLIACASQFAENSLPIAGPTTASRCRSRPR